MPVEIIDGKKVAAEIRSEVKAEISTLSKKPGLATVLVGEDPASEIYVKSKIKACEEVGIYSEHYQLDANIPETELLSTLKKLNEKDKINGILVQLPLPPHINSDTVINAISPEKDVDCFHPINLGKFFTKKTWKEMEELTFLPCTPAGVIELFKRYSISLQGKKLVILGRSNIVGKPLGMMCLANNATVCYCHSRTVDLPKVTSQADIVVAAIGKGRYVTKDFVKDGAVVVDVGMNRTNTGLAGDVDFENIKKKASYITPVPGGVGPMTIAMLMKNTLRSVLALK
ncbi:MAG: tetrahydrofolate dehydrogenase/cyclohydrolase catalytic domain-containing protein [bacterium]